MSGSGAPTDGGAGAVGEGLIAGVLIVGLGGNNGVTLLAGIRANQEKLEWETAVGKVGANYYGCITQLPSKGGKGGYRERYALADANKAAVGGWDIRATALGDALYESHVLDYDLVRQVREYLNSGVEVMKGVWNPSFIGESQHASATHVVNLPTHQHSLDHLRADIRRFKSERGVTGHTTVIWSASVERPCLAEFETAEQLLSAISANDPEVSPSLLYAAAAALEGCSFVNGGSQNTLCPGLVQLADQHGAYVLGTDFKAGQTKFKTAAVEYLRALGLRPVVMASSNHLGNNDMLNLTSKKTLDAKMRVKSDIFAGWGEDIDHQVRVMYTPFIGDEKRDIVEYTSLGFLGCPHTMLTYTRCMDSILCVPLMLDVAVWCDFFARHRHPSTRVSLAMSYLFKVPEGGAQGVDPGFFHQMALLEEVLAEAAAGTTTGQQQAKLQPAAGKDAGGAGPLAGGVVCVGLSCLDLMLLGASGQGEAFGTINTYQQQVFCPGGSAPQSSLALGELGVSVQVLTKMGQDVHGDELLRQLQSAGVDTRLVIRDRAQSTSLAVLPILKDSGARGCFVGLQANQSFTPAEALAALTSAPHGPLASSSSVSVSALHFGYPHLMGHFQGPALRDFLTAAQQAAAPSPLLLSVDLNGVHSDSPASVLEAALPLVDVLHLNEAEAALLTPVPKPSPSDPAGLRAAASHLHDQGVAVVALTLGEHGAYVSVTPHQARLQASAALGRQAGRWGGQAVLLPVEPVTPGAEVNTNGAGDAFIAGLVAALVVRQDVAALSLRQATRLALLAARQRVDSVRRAQPHKTSFSQLLHQVLQEEEEA